ncbi:hypothetical protein AGLY_005420 [Aphis glycines]|uniref:Uncharacterized protein n=1 Tax=Aphis glycines TaxID=307491 RepID=A0A6G0TTY6_APHGL|nr:hypothetical protein AGLY_005420 [Aphis glycines]
MYRNSSAKIKFASLIIRLTSLNYIINACFVNDPCLLACSTSCLNYKGSLLFQMLRDKPINRLKSRKPPGLTTKNLINTQFCSKWTKSHVTNKDLITRPDQYIEGMPGQGRCGSLLFKWRCKDSVACDCGEVEQTMKHIVELCLRSQRLMLSYQIYGLWIVIIIFTNKTTNVNKYHPVNSFASYIDYSSINFRTLHSSTSWLFFAGGNCNNQRPPALFFPSSHIVEFVFLMREKRSISQDFDLFLSFILIYKTSRASIMI